MGKNINTYEKRRREVEKKRKAEEKRARRRNKKNDAEDYKESGSLSATSETTSANPKSDPTG